MTHEQAMAQFNADQIMREVASLERSTRASLRQMEADLGLVRHEAKHVKGSRVGR